MAKLNDLNSAEASLSPCPVCGEAGMEMASAIPLHDRRKGLAGTWRVAPCTRCGAMSMIPLPTEAQLDGYYAAYARDDTVDLNLKPGSRSPTLRKLFHAISGDVDPRDFVIVPDGARVLDYGCGLAGYLRDFHERGISISGAEIADYVVEACRKHGLDVRQVESLSRIPFDDAEFDVVYLMQVFEHLREPHAFMQELCRILKPDGALYLAVPNADSLWRRVFGINWISGWFAPFHLFHYNRQNLARLASEHGFDLVDSWSRTPESWFRLNLKAWLWPGENRLDWQRSWLDHLPVRYLLMLMLRLIEWPIRQRDCLVVLLQKK